MTAKSHNSTPEQQLVNLYAPRTPLRGKPAGKTTRAIARRLVESGRGRYCNRGTGLQILDQTSRRAA